MASFRQHGSGWQGRIRRRGYPDVTKTFETKADAEKWARSVESEIDKGQFVNVSEAQRTTLGDVIARYLTEALKDPSTSKRPVFVPTTDQIANMRTLATLIETGEDANIVELLEIYRELGDFAKADVLLPLIPEGYETEAALQKNLLAEKFQAPALIKW